MILQDLEKHYQLELNVRIRILNENGRLWNRVLLWGWVSKRPCLPWSYFSCAQHVLEHILECFSIRQKCQWIVGRIRSWLWIPGQVKPSLLTSSFLSIPIFCLFLRLTYINTKRNRRMNEMGFKIRKIYKHDRQTWSYDIGVVIVPADYLRLLLIITSGGII